MLAFGVSLSQRDLRSRDDLRWRDRQISPTERKLPDVWNREPFSSHGQKGLSYAGITPVMSGPRNKIAPQRVVFPSERVGPANEGQPASARNIAGDAESPSLAGVARGIVSQFAFAGGMAEVSDTSCNTSSGVEQTRGRCTEVGASAGGIVLGCSLILSVSMGILC